MTSYNLKLVPQDLLFLRDARPMSGADAGLGAQWPRPDQLWSALIHAFLRKWPDRQEWEGAEHTFHDEKVNGKKPDLHQDSSFRFGALNVMGPFPRKGKTLFFPCPLDLAADDSGNLHPMTLVDGSQTNLPSPLKYSLQAPVLGKAQPPRWISLEEYEKYLAGESFLPAFKESDLYSVDRSIGIALDGRTRTTEEGRLYQAEYLRLAEGVAMAFMTSCEISPKQHRDLGLVDVWAKLGLPNDVVMGGQQGVATIAKLEDGVWSLPSVKEEPKDGRTLVRWTLLSPLISPEGWRPSWIAADGQVMLKASVERKPGEDRQTWRKRIKEEAGDIRAKLVAARIGKPLCFSGWDMQTGPKPTVCAVPAGSAFYFECESQEAARELWKKLDCTSQPWGARLSSQFGEKGFGFGVCSLVDDFS